MIVELRPDQWERLRSVRITALEDAPYAFGSTAAEAHAKTDQDWIEAFSRGRWFVAVVDGIDMGLVQLSLQTIGPDCALGIFSMWVDARARGTTAAAALITTAIEKAREAMAPKVVLWVAEGNARALAFYRKVGFTIAVPDVSLVEDCEDFMELSLR